MDVDFPSVFEIVNAAVLFLLVTVQLNCEVCSTLAAGMVTVFPAKVAKLVAGLVLPKAAMPALVSMQLALVNCQATLGCVSVKLMAAPSVAIETLVNAATVVLTLSAVVVILEIAVGNPLLPAKPKSTVLVAPPWRILLMLIFGLSSSMMV